MTEQENLDLRRADARDRAAATGHRLKTADCFALGEYERGVIYGWTAEQWNHLRTNCQYCERTIASARRAVAEQPAPPPARPPGTRFTVDPNGSGDAERTPVEPPEKPGWFFLQRMSARPWVLATAVCGALVVGIFAYRQTTSNQPTGGSIPGGATIGCPEGATCVAFAGQRKVDLVSASARSLELCLDGAPAAFFETGVRTLWRLSLDGLAPIESGSFQGDGMRCATLAMPASPREYSGDLYLFVNGVSRGDYKVNLRVE